MELPIQARPVMRNVSSVRISEVLMSGVTASECDMNNCGWALGACAATSIFGPGAVAACLIGAAGLDCRDCVEKLIPPNAPRPISREDVIGKAM